ncbi:GNAT family N-acetyltransferase, partial [Metapseudomonas otitidis]
MTVRAATAADLDELSQLFSGYLDFYRVPRPLQEIRRFLGERLERGDSVIFVDRDESGDALGFVQLYPFMSS